MLGLEDYGSDSDDQLIVSGAPQPAKKTQRPPKKFAIALPVIKTSSDDEGEDIERPMKRQKTGIAASSLFSMLPSPKQANPAQRVLGSGGAKGSSSTHHTQSTAIPPNTAVEGEEDPATVIQGQSASTLFRPPSLAKGKKNVSVEEPGVKHSTKTLMQKGLSAPTVDFFSLGATQCDASPPVEKSTLTVPSLPHTSSAPTLPTFEPPEPTPTDPYPGYYQLPSDTWAAYDAEYYAKFMKKWQGEYDAYVRALEKGVAKGFEGFEDSAMGEVNAQKEMERAKKEIQEREEKKAITMGADGGLAAPRMTMTASKLSGIARSRHQLSTLLKEAYENREALEERIAQGKRNRKEAGNKYGF